MAENVVDALIVTLGLDSSDYQQGMEEAEHTTREFSEKAPREAERGLNMIEAKFGATFRGIFHTFIAPLTAALGTMGIFSQYTQTADRIGKTAARIGASAEDLQAFGEAAKRAGGSVEGFMGAFESLNGQLQRMQAMGGKGRITPILKQLGISATENGQVKDTFQILRELASASERLGKQKFAGLARFLGLDQGTIMLLQSGRVAMDELIARQRALGVYTKEDFEITAKFNDAISDLQQSFRAMAAPILQVITPALTTLAKWLTNIVQTFREHQGFIVAGLTVIAATMSGVLLKAATALGAALMPLLGPIAAIAALGAIFDEIATYAEGGETAFQGLWEAIGTPEDFKAVGKAVQDFASGAWETISGLAKDVGGAFVDVVSEWSASFDASAFVKDLSDAFAPLKEALEPIKKAAASLLSAIGEILKTAGTLSKTLFEIFAPSEPGEQWSILKSIISAISEALSGVAGVAERVFKFIGDIAKQARSMFDSGAFDGLKELGDSLSQGFSAVIGVASELFGLVSDIVKSVLSLFSPGEPSGEWNILKSVIDGIVEIIKLMVGWVTDLLNLVKRVIKWIRSLGGNSEEEEKRAQKDILGEQTKEAYIASQAAKIKAESPGMSDAQATEAAEKQLAKQTDQQVATNRTADNDALWMSMVNVGGQITNQAPDRTQITQNNRAETSNSYETNIGSVTVNTAATDAQGIARELPGAIRDNAPLLSSSLAAENRGSN